MRLLGLIVAGVIGGAAAGVLAGALLVWIWSVVLGLPTIGDDPKGLGTVATFVLPGLVLGVLGCPAWLVVRHRSGRTVWPVLALLGLCTLALLVMLVGLP